MKFPPWWGYGYFLELHIEASVSHLSGCNSLSNYTSHIISFSLADTFNLMVRPQHIYSKCEDACFLYSNPCIKTS